jgi:hypothetical protein
MRNTSPNNMTIYSNALFSFDYPDMSKLLQGSSFPKLHCLYLQIYCFKLFSDQELAHWGDRGRWTDLNALSLSHVPQLLSFIGRTPKLSKLNLCPQHQIDMDLINNRFGERKGAVVFPSLRGFLWYPTDLHIGTVPWNILKHAPRFTALDVSR